MNNEPCLKCGYESGKNKNKFGIYLCDVCYVFSPNNPEELDIYIHEKINADSLTPFRKYALNFGLNNLKGMISKAKKGNTMSRAPLGYKILNKKLIPSEDYRKVEDIFNEFLNQDISLNKLAKKYNLSVNGLKKILTNFTYVGKIKFNGEIHKGNHQPILSSTLFNHVQNKLEEKGIKKS